HDQDPQHFIGWWPMSETQTPLRRGLVLMALHGQYPMPLTNTSLNRAVSAFYAGTEPRAQTRDLAYLKERGLIRSENHEISGRTFQTWTLTAVGVDVVEGVVQ